MSTAVIVIIFYLLSLGLLARLASWHAILVPRGSTARAEVREIYSELPHWIQDSNLLLTVLLVGRVVFTVVGGACAAMTAVLVGNPYLQWTVGVVMVLLVPIVGEVIPRAKFRVAGKEDVRKAAQRLDVMHRFFLRYVRVLVMAPADLLVRFLGGDPLGDGPFGDTDSDRVLEQIDTDGESLAPSEQRMIRDIFELSETRIREVMSPRTSMECLEIDSSLAEVLDKVNSCFHSRIPVYKEDLDHIVGILVVKDLFKVWKDRVDNGKEEFRLSDFISPPHYAPETKSVSDLFEDLRRERIHIVIVVDEYGGTAGLVTMEDLLEEFVGEIQDEHDLEKPPYVKQAEGVYLVEATMHIDDLKEQLGIEIPQDEEYDTISGYVSTKLGRLPDVGEFVECESILITVEKADERKIDRVRIEIRPQTNPE